MKRILDDIKNFKGNVLCIGVKDKKIMSSLKKNSKIGVYELSRDEPKRFFGYKKRVKISKGRSVRIKKFRKLFKKKSIEYLIIDLNSIFDHYKFIASNSIYVCRKKIYIYGNSDYINAKLVAKKFERYKTKIERVQLDNEYLVVVDCSKAKYNFFKEKIYLIVDTFHNFGDMISYFLTS